MAKNYYLKCEKIIDSISNFITTNYQSEKCNITPKELPPDCNKARIEITIGDKNLLLNVFFKTKGQTLQPQGKNQEITNEIISKIEEDCSIEYNETSYSVRKFSEEKLTSLFSRLSYPGDEFKETEIAKIYLIKGSFNSEVTITYYTNKTLFLQGRPSCLFSVIRSFLYEQGNIANLLSEEEKKVFVQVDRDGLEVELEQIFDKEDLSKVPYDIQTLLKDSIEINKIQFSKLYDYSLLLVPAYRALEAMIKYCINQNTDEIVDLVGNYFASNSVDKDDFKLKSEFKKKKLSEINVHFLEKGYNIYHNSRNIYLHGNPLHCTMIDERAEAEEVLHSIYVIINEIFDKLIKDLL